MGRQEPVGAASALRMHPGAFAGAACREMDPTSPRYLTGSDSAMRAARIAAKARRRLDRAEARAWRVSKSPRTARTRARRAFAASAFRVQPLARNRRPARMRAADSSFKAASPRSAMYRDSVSHACAVILRRRAAKSASVPLTACRAERRAESASRFSCSAFALRAAASALRRIAPADLPIPKACARARKSAGSRDRATEGRSRRAAACIASRSRGVKACASAENGRPMRSRYTANGCAGPSACAQASRTMRRHAESPRPGTRRLRPRKARLSAGLCFPLVVTLDGSEFSITSPPGRWNASGKCSP